MTKEDPKRHYNKDIYSRLEALCQSYQVSVVKAEGLTDRYRCVAFTQAYNERRHAQAFLNNVRLFCDRLVVLDDGSTDDTGSFFIDNQVMIHLRREKNSGFNDYSNRSLLMETGRLVNTRYMLFLDLDERIDPLYSTAFKWLLRLKGLDHVRFPYVHVWDQECQYRTDYPHSRKGVQYRLKMIRKKAQMNIQDKKRLHFELKPYTTTREMNTQVLITHLGNLEPENRWRRYSMYKKLDPGNQCQSSYEHLVARQVKTMPVATLHKSTFTVIVSDLLAYLSMLASRVIPRYGNKRNSHH